ncbi:MAG: hypothetical protein ACREQY_20770 [Candidatus Binatia bacterium]
MNRLFACALALIGLLALSAVLGSSAAYAADGCHDNCKCAPSEQAPSGSTKGCIEPQAGTVSVCGDAGSGAPVGCVCVGATCINNFATVPAQGCKATTIASKCGGN